MPLDFTQSSEQFLGSLDTEIKRLQQMREQIAAALGTETKAKSVAMPKRKGMSEEGRRKIAEAQKARWAKQKNADSAASKRAPSKAPALKKVPAKKTAAKKSSAKQTATKNVSVA